MNLVFVSKIIQIILSIFLVLLTLVQSKGQGLSSSFSGSIGFYRSRRGLEKGIFIMTIIVAFLLAANSIAIVLLS